MEYRGLLYVGEWVGVSNLLKLTVACRAVAVA